MPRPRVVVLDHGSGNLRSAERALARVGADVVVTGDPDGSRGVPTGWSCRASAPSPPAWPALRDVRGPEIIGRRLAGGRPVLGICVGMQVLFESGDEHGVRDRGLRRVAGHRRAAQG